MGVKFTGDWKGVNRFLGSAKSGKFTKMMKKELDELAEHIRTEAVSTIILQSGKWEPLKDSTVARKGGNTMIFFDTGKYVKAIHKKLSVQSTFEMKAIIGPKDKKVPGKQFNYTELASMLEFGTPKMVARPLWTPLFQNMKQWPIYKDFCKKWSRKISGVWNGR